MLSGPNTGDDITATLLNTYDGNYGDFTMDMTFSGASELAVDYRANQAQYSDDGASLSLTGTYIETNTTDNITLDFLNESTPVISRNQGGNAIADGSFGFKLNGVGPVNPQFFDIDLDIATSKSITNSVFEKGVSSRDYSIIGRPNGDYLDTIRIQRRGSDMRFVGDLGTLDLASSNFNTNGHTFDFGSATFSGILSLIPAMI